MSGKTVTLNLVDICTLEGHPAPTPGTVDGHLVLDYQCDDPKAAVLTARAIVRELVKFRQDKHVQGTRTGSKLMFAFNMRDQELPATWRGKAGHAGNGSKPQLLVDLQAALKPYAKAAYFDSSVNQGLVIEDVPVGLQFEVDEGELVAKLLKSKKGAWTSIPMEGPEQAIALIRRLKAIALDLGGTAEAAEAAA